MKFIIGIYKGEPWIFEKIKTPLLDKYAIYGDYWGRLQFDISHYFEEMNRDRTIDAIIEKERWLWRGEGCKNSKKTFALLDKIDKEDEKIKNAFKLNYYEYEGKESFKVVGNSIQQSTRPN